MKIGEYKSDELLINAESLKQITIATQTQEKIRARVETDRTILLTIAGIFVTAIISVLPVWESENGVKNFIYIAVIFVCFVVGLIFLIDMILYKQKKDDEDVASIDFRILNEAKRLTLYTALLIICFQDKKGNVKFATERNGNFLLHCEMDPCKEAKEQGENIINFLANTYSVQRKNVNEVIPLSGEPFFSIKPVHEKTKQNEFMLFLVKFRKNAKSSLINHKDIAWKTIKEMEGSPDLMARNQDIIFALNNCNARISDSFEIPQRSLHIIWNITKSCPYECNICATRDDSRKELSTEEKMRVLNNIFGVKDSIQMIDFAGGDPLCDSEVRTVITQAINSLGEDRISVTTTGEGIQNAKQDSEIFPKLVKNCEITIDASHEHLSSSSRVSPFSRNSPDYCRHNYKQVREIVEDIQTLTVNVPLLDDDLSEAEIDNLIEEFKELRKVLSSVEIRAQLIRLMPVGAFNEHYESIDDYKRYNPINVARTVYNRLMELNIQCRYHCSLRVLPHFGNSCGRCHMLDKKIGIDCAGNVFACTWGAYLRLDSSEDISCNPFYLGNLLSSSLDNILYSPDQKNPAHKRLRRDISNKTSKRYCEAISWFFNRDIGICNDPLAKDGIENEQ